MSFQNGCINVVEFLFLSVGSYFDLKNREIPVNYLLIFGVLGMAEIHLRCIRLQALPKSADTSK